MPAENHESYIDLWDLNGMEFHFQHIYHFPKLEGKFYAP